jgi:hypothetical protein
MFSRLLTHLAIEWIYRRKFGNVSRKSVDSWKRGKESERVRYCSED